MSSNRILTTHVGSLVRPPKLIEFLRKIEDRQPYDQVAYEACLKELIEEVVRQQADAGIDIVSDGEFSKGRNWAFYVHDRLSGVTTRSLTEDEAKESHGVRRRRSGPRRVPRVLRRIRPGLRTGQAARRALRGQCAADLLRRSASNATSPTSRPPPPKPRSRAHSFQSSRRQARCRTPRTSIIRTRRACCGRSPTACTRNTNQSSMPAFTCRSMTPSYRTCTKRWCPQ